MKKNSLRVLNLIVMAAFLCGLVVSSCSNSECYDNKNSLPLAGFYASELKPSQIYIDSISIYGIGAPGDSILLDSVSRISQAYLPFRIDQGETTYVIQYLEGLLGEYHITDTIKFNYDIKPWFVSSACGVVYYYKMLSIETTHNLIDSVICPSGEITNAMSENLRIYFKVSEDVEGGEE